MENEGGRNIERREDRNEEDPRELKNVNVLRH